MEAERGKRAAESLGWLTESAVMPTKHRAIEGVGSGSIVELKAQLYRTQEEARNAAKDSNPAEFLRAKKKPLPDDLLSRKNSGVDSRAKRDKLELKAVNDGSASYAALEKKAELYDKLASGVLPDEEEKEKYCVDFFQKSFFVQEDVPEERPENRLRASEENKKDAETADMLLNAKLVGPGRTSATVNHDEHKRLVREVHEEASQAREKASAVKMRRQEQEAARREKLRQAYLRKQLLKLTSVKQTSGER